MKLYIYEYADCNVTSGYHGGGGVIICTAGDPQEAWAAKCADKTDDAGKRLGDQDLGKPDRIMDTLPDAPEFVTVFPDQGCC